MTNRFLVTPENWFDLLRLAESATVHDPIEFAVTDVDGRSPLGQLPLHELRAVHETFGAWWSRLGDEGRPDGVPAGSYDRFLDDHRRLLAREAERALASAETGTASAASAVLRFPVLGHPLLANQPDALAFLRSFLPLMHAPSLLGWARELAMADDARETCRKEIWVRLLLQKAAVEDELSEAVDCLRSVYAAPDGRMALVADETRCLEACGLPALGAWARALGIDRPERNARALEAPGRRQRSSTSTPDVTVLIPSYGHAAFIEATLESVLAQTYEQYHVVVVDDRSADDTVERAARIRDPRLLVRVNPINMGLGDSVRRALRDITTPYVALLNSDDLFHPDRLERCREVLIDVPDAQVVATGLAPIDDRGRRLTVDTVSRLLDGPAIADWIAWFAGAGHVSGRADLLAELLERNVLVTSSNLVCRTAFLRDRSASLRGLRYCLDWQLFLDAAIDRALIHLPDELLGYRLHSTNTVWFDRDRYAGYAQEVNRVLGHAFRQLRQRSARPDGRDRTAIFDLLANHAIRHSAADIRALYLNELLDGRRPEEAVGGAGAIWTTARPANHDTPGASSPGTTVGFAAATRLVIAHEEAVITRAAERIAREEARRVGQRLEQQQNAWREADGARRLADEERRRSEDTWRADRAALEQKLAATSDELARLRSSQEWLAGEWICHRARLARPLDLARRTLHSLRDRRNRWALALGRFAHQAGFARPTAVVASCWNFPTHSHTFVYEEMRALEWAGFDCRVFCCSTNPKSELHPAFESLWRRRVTLDSDWRRNRADYEHFRGTRSERVESLMALLGHETGLDRDALLQESIVMMGFTFARHVELAGAEYLHTYFFYDQSFLALMAAYLLQIPRGVTAYADHMLTDYPFKCVPLHLELADIVVATSCRIRDELSEIGAGRFDAKIIVKPNGIDTTRFPYADAETRLACTEPELLSVSRIEPKKGLIHLVEAVGVLKGRGVHVRLNIVGGPDQNVPASVECHRKIVEKIEELQLSDRVVLHGILKQPQFIPLLASARLFVAPYVEVASGDKDGIPTSVLEALSSGLPVIATDAGSIREAVADGVEGLSVRQRDPVALADAIQKLLADRALYARMGEAARRRAVSEFDVHVTERRLHERIARINQRAVLPVAHEVKVHG